MSIVTQSSEHANMDLPPGQDVIADDMAVLCWQSGPLPSADLEHIAWLLFQHKYPETSFDNSLMSSERDDCRRLALRIRVKCLVMDRWTLFDAVERLTDQSLRLCFGDRRIGPTLRNQVRDYCSSFMEDLLAIWPQKLFYARDVEANQIEIERNDRKSVKGVEPDGRD